jgi:GntR family transcriptional regulator
MTGTRLYDYQRIAEDLRGRIRRGELSDRLPNERDLAAEYEVAVPTMRSALGILAQEGLIRRKPKVGTIVVQTGKFLRDGPGRMRPGPKRFFAADIDSRERQVTNFRSGVHIAREDERNLILCFGAETPLIFRERLYKVEGEPVYMATNYMPQELFPDRGEVVLREHPGQDGIHGRLQEVQHEAVEGDEYIEARPATVSETKTLKLPSGSWVFLIHRPLEDAEGRVVDLAVITLPAYSWILRYPVMRKPARR